MRSIWHTEIPRCRGTPDWSRPASWRISLAQSDLIPDPIPVLGDVDDLLLLPLGVALVMRLIRTQVVIECRGQAQARAGERPPVSWVAAAVIVALCLVLSALSVRLVLS